MNAGEAYTLAGSNLRNVKMINTTLKIWIFRMVTGQSASFTLAMLFNRKAQAVCTIIDYCEQRKKFWPIIVEPGSLKKWFITQFRTRDAKENALIAKAMSLLKKW